MLAHLAISTALLHATLVAAKAATTTTAAKKSSGSSTIILFLVVILGAGYFLYMRPRSRARLAQTQQANQRQLEVGDEVATTAGIVGRVRRIHDDRVELEIAPGMVIQVLRQNVGRPLATNAPLSEPGADDGNRDHWDEDTSTLLAPGGLRDDTLDEHDDDSGAPDGAEPDALPSYGGPAGARTSAASPSARSASASASAAGSRAARSRRRPSTSAPGDRPAGWSRTSDEAASSGDDDRPAGSPAAGSGN